MELIFIASILLSAFSHAFYNFLMHRAGGSRLFLLVLFFIAATCASIAYLFYNTHISLTFSSFLYIYIASLFYVLYQNFVSKSYQKGEISKLYPLTVISPIFVPIWAGIFLHETITFYTILGIVITTYGAMSIKQSSLHPKAFIQIFSKNNSYKGAWYAIFASLFYSVGSVVDKAKIGSFELIPYLWVLLCCMAANMLLISIIFERSIFKDFNKMQWKFLLLAGVVAYISFISFRFALQYIPVSIAVPLRLSSVFFALLLGILFTKEQLTKQKFFSVLIIILGILTIQLTA